MTDDYRQNIRDLLRGPDRLVVVFGRGIPPPPSGCQARQSLQNGPGSAQAGNGGIICGIICSRSSATPPHALPRGNASPETIIVQIPRHHATEAGHDTGGAGGAGIAFRLGL